MFGAVYRGMKKEEFLARFENELTEPVFDAIHEIEDNFDENTELDHLDLIQAIKRWIDKYYNHQIEGAFKPAENPFSKMSTRDKDECLTYLVYFQLLKAMAEKITHVHYLQKELQERKEECEEWAEISLRNKWNMES